MNISIITNFGCRSDCWYCIWKEHKLKDVQLETNWDKVKQFFIDQKEQAGNKVSVSGGGDSLYKYRYHKKWWDKLFSITDELNMKVDVHTREKFINDDFFKKINKVVFSSDKLSEDENYLNYLINITQIRITHLVTQYTTIKDIEEYLNYQKITNCQFTIKELVGYDDCGMYDVVRKKYPGIYHLDEGDYNIYYMPDNSIQTKFLF